MDDPVFWFVLAFLLGIGVIGYLDAEGLISKRAGVVGVFGVLSLALPVGIGAAFSLLSPVDGVIAGLVSFAAIVTVSAINFVWLGLGEYGDPLAYFRLVFRGRAAADVSPLVPGEPTVRPRRGSHAAAGTAKATLEMAGSGFRPVRVSVEASQLLIEYANEDAPPIAIQAHVVDEIRIREGYVFTRFRIRHQDVSLPSLVTLLLEEPEPFRSVLVEYGYAVVDMGQTPGKRLELALLRATRRAS